MKVDTEVAYFSLQAAEPYLKPAILVTARTILDLKVIQINQLMMKITTRWSCLRSMRSPPTLRNHQHVEPSNVQLSKVEK